ncbi:MAG: aerotolerance regulator BatA, partial [Planctomycetota bacterium]|nr:aerotolerance regulator BatA [Planctomycetota bacterium]
AKQAAEWGIRIYAIGVGEQPGRRSFFSGPGMDVRTLTTAAEMTGGKFFFADSGDALRDVYAQIDELEKTETESTEYTDYNESFAPFAIAAAIALALELLVGATWLRRTI